ncbi:MAG: hypothetical protein QGI36_06425, partial [Candidatus Thalassarchaeaceae archaeon]|nr:hypothetical protein [Candidatus Thalassarchaeaceae archaeon]
MESITDREVDDDVPSKGTTKLLSEKLFATTDKVREKILKMKKVFEKKDITVDKAKVLYQASLCKYSKDLEDDIKLLD